MKEPTRPEDRSDTENEKIVLERLKTYERDKRKTLGREDVATLIKNLKHPAPR